MSMNPTTRLETALISRTTERDGDQPHDTERLASARLELPPPSPSQYDVFDTILRCDAAETADQRLVDPVLARNVLLDRLNHARNIRQRANSFDPHDTISDTELRDAYCEGADAYAGLITLAPPLASGNEQAMEAFREWSQLAVGAVTRVESQGQGPSRAIFRTPASLAGDREAISSMRKTLTERARFERIKQYWDAAQQSNPIRVREAFVGDDATRLNRAKALFRYAHSFSEDAHDIKVACLEESVVVIHDTVTRGERPREDDLVGVYEYFMLESMLGRSVHDIVWLDGHDTDDNCARWFSVQYLRNAADALNYVRHHLITSQEEPEYDLRRASSAFDMRVKNDPTLRDARATIDFLTTGMQELGWAEDALLDLKNNPYDYPSKETELAVAEKKVAYLRAKAEYEQLEQKITEQQDIIRQRFGAIYADHQHIADRLLAQRSKLIGDILPGTYGRRLALLVLDIDQQLSEALYFATLYEQECKQDAQYQYELQQQLGAAVVRLLHTLEGIGPNDEAMDAGRFRTPATT